MHDVNWHAERISDATRLNEQAIVDPLSSIDRSTQTVDPLRLSIEMAIEWAHLGGD